MKYRRAWIGSIGLLALLWLAALFPHGSTAQARGAVYYVTVDRGLTGPAAATVRRAIREAQAANASALVVEIRGSGSLRVAWPLARDLNAASVPTVVYVAPRGANAGAIGSVLLAGAHVGVMAPATTVGFAAPLVDIPAGFSAATQQLVVDDAVKQLTDWARARNLNADWLEQAARSGAIIDADRARALQPPLIDAVASEDELLSVLQGRRVTLANGQSDTLQTLGAQIRHVEPTIWEGLGQLLAIPTVAFLLFVVGAIAVYLELSAPGMSIPGATGALLIVAALVGFVLGEVRPLGVVLMTGGLLVIGLEYAATSHGGFTVVGLVLLVIGALFLVDPARTPGLGVSYAVVGGVAATLGTAAIGLVTLAVRARTQRPTTGQEAMIGQIAEVRRPIAPEGMVFVNGALWSAWSDQGPFAAGDLVEVAGIDGLRLYVRHVTEVDRAERS